MDRDKRWDRMQQAYDLIVEGQAPHHADTGVDAVKPAYGRDETDEFINPTTVGDEARIRDQDSVICFNFRPDRMRQLVRALAARSFDDFDRDGRAPSSGWHMASYDEAGPTRWPSRGAPPTTLASVSPTRGSASSTWPRPRSTPHVTYFFNGGDEDPLQRRGPRARALAARRRHLRPQARDERPGRGRRRPFWRETSYGFVIINFANPDMVGHTGVIPAAVKAVETVDAASAEVVAAVQARAAPA